MNRALLMIFAIVCQFLALHLIQAAENVPKAQPKKGFCVTIMELSSNDPYEFTPSDSYEFFQVEHPFNKKINHTAFIKDHRHNIFEFDTNDVPHDPALLERLYAIWKLNASKAKEVSRDGYEWEMAIRIADDQLSPIKYFLLSTTPDNDGGIWLMSISKEQFDQEKLRVRTGL